jgi:hypothetical protein
MTRRWALLFLAGMLTAAIGTAADDELPKAETILDRYIEVTGGKQAYQNRKSEMATGTVDFAAQGIKGTLMRYAAEPDKSYAVVDIEGIGKIETGTGNGIAWEKSLISGPRVVSGDEKAQALRENLFNADFNWRKLYPKVETSGIETVDGEECYKLILTPAEGHPQTAYYQKKSGLVVKMTTILVSSMGDIPVEAVMSNYKEFGGILMPTKITQKAAGQEVSRTIQSLKINQEFAPDRFDPPAEIKALLNKAASKN